MGPCKLSAWPSQSNLLKTTRNLRRTCQQKVDTSLSVFA